jgi:transposase
MADELDPGRLDDLYDIGVDEISWKKHHNYLTLVVNHTTNKVVWGAEGRDAKTLDGLFDELGQARSGQIRAVSMDMGSAFRKSVLALPASAVRQGRPHPAGEVLGELRVTAGKHQIRTIVQ